jgi:hypothetical protein
MENMTSEKLLEAAAKYTKIHHFDFKNLGERN